MKFTKLFSTLVLTTIMVFAFVITGSCASATYQVSPSEGSTVKPGDSIGVIQTLPGNLGFKEASISLIDGETGTIIRTNTNNITDKEIGNNPVSSIILVPVDCTAKSLIARVQGKDVKGASYSKEFKFNGPNTGNNGGNNGNNGNTISIKPSVPSGSVIKKDSKVTFTTTSTNVYVGTKTCNVKVFNDDTNEKLYEKTGTSSYANGSNPLDYTKVMSFEPGRYRVEVFSTDILGNTAKGIYYYTIVDNDDEPGTPDEPKDDVYEGIINPDLDGLVIDLWLREDTRFYELDEDNIPFVAYYYNADKKAADKVTIEVEVPDGFEVVSKSTPYGSVKVKNDVITYNIGTVPSKEVRAVYFTLKATDEDTCEVPTNVVAVILQDDDEEDQSTQRIMIYEEGGKGQFAAYVTGYPDTSFRADNNITREEVAAIMARAFNLKAGVTSKTFSDVKKNSWSYNYIMACATKGIVNGYANGTFKPFGNITRGELYAMTYRAMEIPEDEKALFVPKQYKKLDSWEKNYIAGLVRLKMLTDMKERDAEVEATRAEVVYLVNGVQFRNPSKRLDVFYNDLSNSHWAAKDICAASVNYSYKRGEDGKEIVIK